MDQENEKIVSIMELAVKAQANEDRSKSNARRLDEYDRIIADIKEDGKTLIRLVSSVEVIANNLADVNNKVDSIGDKQDELSKQVLMLENKPAQDIKNRYESIRDKIAWLVIGGVVGWMFYTLFPMMKF